MKKNNQKKQKKAMKIRCVIYRDVTDSHLLLSKERFSLYPVNVSITY